MDPDPEPGLDPLRIRLRPRRHGPSQCRIERAVTLPQDQAVLDPLVKLAVCHEFQINVHGRQTTTRSRSENSSMVPVAADPPAVRPTTRGSAWMAAIAASTYGRTCRGAQSAMVMR